MPARKRATKSPKRSRPTALAFPWPADVRGNSHRGAYRKGYTAGAAGKGERSNPYTVKKSPVVRGLHYTWERGRAAGTLAQPAGT